MYSLSRLNKLIFVLKNMFYFMNRQFIPDKRLRCQPELLSYFPQAIYI